MQKWKSWHGRVYNTTELSTIKENWRKTTSCCFKKTIKPIYMYMYIYNDQLATIKSSRSSKSVIKETIKGKKIKIIYFNGWEDNVDGLTWSSNSCKYAVFLSILFFSPIHSTFYRPFSSNKALVGQYANPFNL